MPVCAPARGARACQGRIETRVCPQETLAVDDLRECADFVLAFNVLHEAADPGRMVREMAASLRPGGRLLLSEPRRHLLPDLFARECELCRQQGLAEEAGPTVRGQRTVVYRR